MKKQKQLLESIIDRTLQDFYPEITSAQKKWNQKIRSILRLQTAFKLNLDVQNEDEERRIVPVNIENLTDYQLEQFYGKLDDEFLKSLKQWDEFKDTLQGLKYLSDNYIDFMSKAAGHSVTIDSLQDIINLIESLEPHARAKDILQNLKSKGSDVMGLCNFSPKQYDSYNYLNPNLTYCAEITLYANSIALSSLLMNIPIKHLTVIVLAHELAHAYTISGFDLDGKSIATDLDYQVKEIIEGVAVYYSGQVCRKLETSLWGITASFKTHLKYLPESYTKCLQWIKDIDQADELIRSAFLSYRRRIKCSYEEFLDIMDNTKQRLSGTPDVEIFMKHVSEIVKQI